MTKQNFIDRLNKIAEVSAAEGWTYTVKLNDWENYGKSRTFFSIVETRNNNKHYTEKKYGYYDNKSETYVPDKYGNLSSEILFDFSGNKIEA